MKKEKKLTLYIMTWERPEYLDQCLNSIENQIYNDFNLVILDDASKKDYSKILTKYKHLNFEYIKHKNNIGLTNNFYFAITRKVKTKYLMVFHDDDIMDKSLLINSINYLDKNQQISWIGSISKIFRNEIPEFKNQNIIKIKEYTLSELCNFLILGSALSLPSVIYRISDLNYDNFKNLVTNYSTGFWDRPFLFQQLQSKKCAVINNKLVGWRLSSTYQVSKDDPYTTNQLFNLFLAYKAPLLNNKIFLFNYFVFFSSLHLIDSFFRINNSARPNFFLYIKKSLKLKIINIWFVLFFLISLLRILIMKGPKKIILYVWTIFKRNK